MFLGNSACTFCSFVSVNDILSIYFMLSFKDSSVTFNNPSHSDNISILYSQYWSILLSIGYATSALYLLIVKLSIISVA